ncbi:hypothetical protein ACQPZF_01360 [Actinosynnema sp. CS-041913]|uniref:hypothetical protein n=1 Tax=Actinosynnema sp. CS-041913 TaxID=3239917 RepID=UPI003D89F8B3
MRVRLGDAPSGATVPALGPPEWVRATTRAARRPDVTEGEARQTWLVDSFDLVVPRYPWQRDTDGA